MTIVEGAPGKFRSRVGREGSSNTPGPYRRQRCLMSLLTVRPRRRRGGGSPGDITEGPPVGFELIRNFNHSLRLNKLKREDS